MKKKYTWVVLTNCDSMHEREFNEWYDQVHLRDLLRIPGVTGATRAIISTSQMAMAGGSLTIATAQSIDAKYKYLACYHLETDDIDGFFETVRSRSGTPEMIISPYLLDAYTVMYEDIDRET